MNTKWSSFVTFEDVGHSVLGFSWQNRTEVDNKLWRSKVNNQLPQTITAQTFLLHKFFKHSPVRKWSCVIS